jgi:hypothetical protein
MSVNMSVNSAASHASTTCQGQAGQNKHWWICYKYAWSYMTGLELQIPVVHLRMMLAHGLDTLCYHD